MIAIIATLSIALIVVVLILVNQKDKLSALIKEIDIVKGENARVKTQYKDIIDMDRALNERSEQLTHLQRDYKSKREIYEGLTKEILILEDNLEHISFGLYSPHYSFKTSEEFRQKLEEIREQQKALIMERKAVWVPEKLTINGSLAEGTKYSKRTSKLMLRAFNGECDAIIARVSWNNIGAMEQRIEKAFLAINKLQTFEQNPEFSLAITRSYLKLKLDELRLEYELEERLHQEKEEQRAIKEQMREEQLAQQEMEKVQRDAEEEERRYEKALERARMDVENATGQKLDELNAKIKELEVNLQQAQAQRQRAISQAQLTKSGHVYIISNIGSFGENIYKIGMTRRLEPMERVQELGDASVPFAFDVHAMVYSVNAPELESALHKKFDAKRVNLMNQRKEFYNVTLEEIEEAARELKLEIQITKLAEARDYRESQSIRETKAKLTQPQVVPGMDKFPQSI